MDHHNSVEVLIRHYDPKIHRKLHQNANPFVLRKYDGRIKKCCGCKISFKSTTGAPKYVIAHREMYVCKLFTCASLTFLSCVIDSVKHQLDTAHMNNLPKVVTCKKAESQTSNLLIATPTLNY